MNDVRLVNIKMSTPAFGGPTQSSLVKTDLSDKQIVEAFKLNKYGSMSNIDILNSYISVLGSKFHCELVVLDTVCIMVDM